MNKDFILNRLNRVREIMQEVEATEGNLAMGNFWTALDGNSGDCSLEYFSKAECGTAACMIGWVLFKESIPAISCEAFSKFISYVTGGQYCDTTDFVESELKKISLCDWDVEEEYDSNTDTYTQISNFYMKDVNFITTSDVISKLDSLIESVESNTF